MTRVDPDAWAQVRQRGQQLGRWTERAVELAAEHEAQDPPGRIARWRGQRAARRAERFAAARPLHAVQPAAADPQPGGRLRYIPPVAALGTAWVLQVIAMTDIVGGRVAQVVLESEFPHLAAYGYLAGLLLGIAVASGWEGGAAYLMDLYDKHLLARDSVGLLRVAMVAYVAVSGAILHWWLSSRELPELVAWVLAALSGSALFLWSRGSRWKNREAMRSAGQLDPALPKLPAAAKIFHPIRWVVTLYLISWTPAANPEQARARYEEWATERRKRRTAGAAKTDARTDARRTLDETAPTPSGPSPEPGPSADGAPGEPEQDAGSGAPTSEETAAQRARQDSRTAQEIEDAVRAIAAARPSLSRRRIATIANTPATNVRRILGPASAAEAAQRDEPASAPGSEPLTEKDAA